MEVGVVVGVAIRGGRVVAAVIGDVFNKRFDDDADDDDEEEEEEAEHVNNDDTDENEAGDDDDDNDATVDLPPTNSDCDFKLSLSSSSLSISSSLVSLLESFDSLCCAPFRRAPLLFSLFVSVFCFTTAVLVLVVIVGVIGIGVEVVEVVVVVVEVISFFFFFYLIHLLFPLWLMSGQFEVFPFV